jgi:ferredoxin
MITAEQKSIAEIRMMIAPYRKIMVLGCGSCVAECAAGGQKEASMLASALGMAAKMAGEDKVFTERTIDRQCVRDFIVQIEGVEANCDAILSLGCGAGVQAVAEIFSDMPVLPALNTEFLGQTKEQGLWIENCVGCGDCMLYYFGGVCPLARCSKQIMNGPCGGSREGRCEVDPDTPCAWQLIIDRLGRTGGLDRLEGVFPAKDWSRKQGRGPRRIIREDQQR